jgi:hypothetical protein
MRDGLRPVNKGERADPVRSFANSLYRIDQTQDVRYVGEHNKLGALGQERFELVESQAPILFHVQNPHAGIGALRGQLPWHETRVVLGHG